MGKMEDVVILSRRWSYGVVYSTDFSIKRWKINIWSHGVAMTARLLTAFMTNPFFFYFVFQKYKTRWTMDEQHYDQMCINIKLLI